MREALRRGRSLVFDTPQLTAPSVPQNLRAIAGDGSVILHWSRSDDVSISGYRYQQSTDDGATFVERYIEDSGDVTASYVVDELSNGTTYTFGIRAENSVGTSEWSESVTVTLIALPAAPTGLSAVPGEGMVTLTWTDPSDGTITKYRYLQSSDGGTTFSEHEMVGAEADTTSYVVSGLTGGTAHTFEIQAGNALGWSGSSSRIVVTPGAPRPAAPTGVTAVVEGGTVTLAWADPGDAGITRYRYRQSSDGGTTFSEHEMVGAEADTTSYVVSGLTGGTAYTFEIQAGNAVGWSTSSSRIVVTPGASPPGAPTGVTAVPGEGTVTLAWADPGDVGINRYQYLQSSDGGTTFSEHEMAGVGADTTNYVVSGLTGGTLYTFEIQAGNSVGWSGSSPRVQATPGASRPAAPTGLTGTRGDGTVTLEWIDPGDATITKYQYRQSADGGATFSEREMAGAGARTASYVVSGLVGGTTYRFRIRAENAIGAGEWSEPLVVMTEAAPPPPTEVTAAAGDREATLAWANPGDASILGYRYRQSSDGGSTFEEHEMVGVGASATRYVVSGLVNGVTYIFEIQAKNALGWGAPSSRVVVTPGVSRPAAPTGLTATRGDGTVTLEWMDPGDATIMGYAYRQSNGGNTYSEYGIVGADAATTSHVVEGLVGGTEYTFWLRAENAASAGEWSAAVTVEPVVQQVTVSWSASEYEVTEGAEAVEIEVVLSAAADRVVTVPVAMALGGGAVWEDFGALPNAVVFEAGSASVVLEVVAAADDDDDPDETLMLEFSTLPDGVSPGAVTSAVIRVVSVRATAAVEGILGVTLTAIARAMAESAQTAIEGRFERYRQGRRVVADEMRGRFSGVRGSVGASLDGWNQGTEDQRLAPGGILRDPGNLRVGRLSQRPFDLELDGATDGGWSAALWGAGDVQRIGGTGQGVTYDAGLQEALIGVDVYAGRGLVGVTYMRTTGELTFGDGGEGALGADLHTVHPYAYWQVAEDLSVWGLAGIGVGNIALTESELEFDAGAEYRSAAGGVRAVVGRRGETEVGVRADVSRSRLETIALEDIDGVQGTARRTRVMVDLVHDVAMGGRRSLSVRVEGGVRFDRGAAGDGRGVETGVRVGFVDPGSGLDLAVQTRALVMHEVEMRQWGFGVSGSWDPGLRGRGARITVSSGLGQDGGGQIGIWDREAVGERAFGGAPAGMAAGELAYGLDAWGGVLTPYKRLEMSGRRRAMSLGTSWCPSAGGLLWRLEGRRARSGAGLTDTAVSLSVSQVF